MDNDKIEILLNQLLEGQQEIKKELHVVVEQTSNLAELKIETITKLDRIRNDLDTVTKVTKQNC